MQWTKLTAWSSLVLTCLLVGPLAAAQTSTTSVQGDVTDPSGAAVANATVELTNDESKTKRETTTDTQGEYRFQFLPPSTYTLVIQAPGFSRFERKGLQLLINTPATVNAQLQLGQATQVVTVSEAPPALNMMELDVWVSERAAFQSAGSIFTRLASPG